MAIAALIPTAVSAQQEGGIVVVLDMNVVFESHGGFKSKMEKIKGEVVGYEEQLKGKGNALRSELETLNATYKAGSPEHQAGEASLAERDAKLGIQATQKRKQVADQQAQVYYDSYQEILASVRKVASQYNVSLVIRYDSRDINREDRNEVIRGINRNVIFQRDLDITDLVLADLGYQRAVAGGDTGTTQK